MPVWPAGMVTNGENAVKNTMSAASTTTAAATTSVLRGILKGPVLPVLLGALPVPVFINLTLLFGMPTV